LRRPHPCRDIFSQGFGPFRWVCTSGDPQDLAVTDQLATSVLEKAIEDGGDAVGREVLTVGGRPKSGL
jgi:urocanate hydratase